MVNSRCLIAEMLRRQKKHISFHTPGHKRAGADITELSYSDCLLSPHGVLAQAERDIAEILGAERSFILTDGSTSGVFAMLYALKRAGIGRIAAPVFSHPSFFHACEVMGLSAVPIMQRAEYGLPLPPSEEEIEAALEGADALFLTSPDYYGYFPPLSFARDICKKAGKPFLIDGAHGGHLHFDRALYAGGYADLWVDGVHKSLPALTQGAVVSANGEWGELLARSIVRFRTTSPSYPIMASVEYAVKYPRNVPLEKAAERFKHANGCVLNADWTKLLVPFGARCGEAQAYLEARGVYPEFNDGNYLMFYLSPCTKRGELKTLARLLNGLPRGEVARDAPAGTIPMYGETE